MGLNPQFPSVGLYIHWPFCISKCPYCDFNSHVREKIEEDDWEKALLEELSYWGKRFSKYPLHSLFFGGGTPSLMNPRTVEKLIKKAEELFTFLPSIEITCEANPNSVEVNKFQSLYKSGVNRVSIGVQSLRPEGLAFLGRGHSVEEAYKAIEVAAQIFPRYSFDLIYTRPGQILQEWEKELEEALSLGSKHLSLYQLTIEEGTAFYQRHRRGDFSLPDEQQSEEFFTFTHQRMAQASLPAYEVSNFSAQGQESRHNIGYWQYAPYFGIGPGAHGRIMTLKGRLTTRTFKAPETWLSHVQKQGYGIEEEIVLTENESFEEALMMGLRLKEGLRISTLKNISEQKTQKLLNSQEVASLKEEGLIINSSTHIQVTFSGMLLLNQIVSYLVKV